MKTKPSGIRWLLDALLFAVVSGVFTVVASLSAQPASPGAALSFNGANQFVNVGAFTVSSRAFTIEFWAAHTRTGSVDVAVSGGTTLASNKFISIGFQSTNSFMLSFLSNDLVTPTAYTDTNWHHWACTLGTNLARKIYRDGVFVAGDTATGSFTGVNGFTFARGLGVNYFAGQLDELRVWNVERSTNEIAQFMNRALVGNEPGLSGYWRFDEGSGNVASDSSASHRSGSLSNAPAWVSSGALFAPALATPAINPGGGNTLVVQTTVVPNRSQAAAWFQWGPSTNYGNFTATNTFGAGTAAMPISASISNLTPGIFYHFQAVASNSAGFTFGLDQISRLPGTFAVTSLADSGPGTLRQLISNSFSGDLLTFATTGTLALTNGQLGISNNLTITGPGAANLAISAAVPNVYIPQGSRVFFINSGVTASISGLTIRDASMTNTYPAASGAGIYNAGTLTLSACLVSNNLAASEAILNSLGTYSGGDGGGIFNSGTLRLDHCTVANNSAGLGRAGSAGTDVYIGGVGAPGGNGGGIYNSGALTLNACTVAGNSAGPGGSGVDAASSFYYAGSGGPGGNGGGIYNLGTLAVNASTVNGNFSGAAGIYIGVNVQIFAGNGGNGGNGGGIYNAGLLAMTNCTIFGNQGAPGGNTTPGPYRESTGLGGDGGTGGGIFSTGTLTFVACTVSGNASGGLGVSLGGTNGINGSGGGIVNTAGGAATFLESSLLALNATPGSSPDLLGSFTSGGHNLIGQSDGSAGFINGTKNDVVGTTASPVNPMIGPLANNGGPSFTSALLVGSPALEGGDDLLTNVLATDQRGFARVSGAHPDTGAYEFDRSALPNPSVATLASAAPTNNSSIAAASTFLNAMVNPGGLVTALFFQYGLTPAYGATTAPLPAGFGTNSFLTNEFVTGLTPGLTYHYRAVATNNMGVYQGADLTITAPLFFPAGDLNGDGVVAQSELNAALSNYWQNSALYMTNADKLAQGYFQFALTNDPAFSVLVSTNLNQWDYLGPAFQVYQFYDPQASTNAPRRFYRLRYP